jgi:PAS domain S-box-containing protein
MAAGRLLAGGLVVFALWSLFCFAEVMVQMSRDAEQATAGTVTPPGDAASERRRVAIRWGISLLLAAGCVGGVAFGERKREDGRSSAFSHAVMQAATDAIFVTDIDLGILAWNPAVERLLGYGKQDVKGQGLECLLPITPEMRQAALRLRDAEVRLKARVIRRDGSRIAMEVLLRQQWLGDRAGFVCTARPAPTASPVEPAYREEIRFLTEVFDAVPWPLLVVGSDGRLQRLNPAAQEAFGCSAVELRGQPCPEILAADELQRDRLKARLEAASAAGHRTAPGDPQPEWITTPSGQLVSWRCDPLGSEGQPSPYLLLSGTLAPAKAAITIEHAATAAVSERSI